MINGSLLLLMQNTGTGWTFSPCTAESFRWALETAMTTYWKYPDAFRGLQVPSLFYSMFRDLSAA